MDLLDKPPTPVIAAQPLPASPPNGTPTWSPRLSVVIVNYRDWNGTAQLVRQLLPTPGDQAGRVEVVVVDNHSPADPTVARLRRLPGLSLRRWKRNLGFARAANEGHRLASGAWLLFLNPDVTLSPDFLDGVLRLTDELTETRTGIVGLQLRNADGSPQLSAGRLPTLTSTLAGLARARHRRKYQALSTVRRQEVAWATGCCLLVRRECFRSLGGFDTRFFMYYEDVDLCRRASDAGWSVCYEPRLWAVHHRPLHTRRVPAILRLITRHALLSYAAKHWPAWQARVLRNLVGLEARMRCWWAKCRLDGAGAACFSDLRTIVQHLRAGRERQAQRQVYESVWRVEGEEV